MYQKEEARNQTNQSFQTVNNIINTDYYPFGMAMEGRFGSVGSYRYAFNGMEKDDEVKGVGNSYTTEFRHLDPRTGRWWSTDPITHPQYSPYSTFDNNPIYYSDPSEADSEGDPPVVGENDANGKEGTLAPNGGTYSSNGGVSNGDNICLGCGANGENTYGIPEQAPTTANQPEPYTSQSDATYVDKPAPNYNIGLDFSKVLNRSWTFHTSYESADVIFGGSLYTTIHYPPKYGTWDNGPIIESGTSTYGGLDASFSVGMSFKGNAYLVGDNYVNNSLYSTLKAGARTTTSGYGFGEILIYNEEWSITYSKDNNAMFKPLYNSWFYGASLGVSVLPGNYYEGQSYTSAIKRMNGDMTGEDSIKVMLKNMYHENAGEMLEQLEKTAGKRKTDSLINSFFDN